LYIWPISLPAKINNPMKATVPAIAIAIVNASRGCLKAW
jgi:hypothetical protein